MFRGSGITPHLGFSGAVCHPPSAVVSTQTLSILNMICFFSLPVGVRFSAPISLNIGSSSIQLARPCPLRLQWPNKGHLARRTVLVPLPSFRLGNDPATFCVPTTFKNPRRPPNHDSVRDSPIPLSRHSLSAFMIAPSFSPAQVYFPFAVGPISPISVVCPPIWRTIWRRLPTLTVHALGGNLSRPARFRAGRQYFVPPFRFRPAFCTPPCLADP